MAGRGGGCGVIPVRGRDGVLGNQQLVVGRRRGDHAVGGAGSSGDEEGGMGEQGGHVQWEGQAQAGVRICRAEETETQK